MKSYICESCHKLFGCKMDWVTKESFRDYCAACTKETEVRSCMITAEVLDDLPVIGDQEAFESWRPGTYNQFDCVKGHDWVWRQSTIELRPGEKLGEKWIACRRCAIRI